jgi:alkylation response protein AidB-like acyl-CoA dehydrogenase
VLLQLSSDQEFFRETTAKFLSDQAPVDVLRRLREDPAGYDADYWRSGAKLGWTSLLVSEEHGGGSISGNGIVDLSVVAHEFGAHAAPGPLLPTSVVAAALSDAARRDTAGHSEVLAGILDGSVVATWCLEEPRRHPLDIEFDVRTDGGDIVLNGVKRPVEAAGQASQLLVTGRTGDGLTQVLVPADAAGVTITAMDSVDLTRRFGAVSFTDVRLPGNAVVGEVGAARQQVDRQLHLALALLNAESVGAMQTAFDMTVQWAADRYSFGRPLASYQALKHRFADMKSWLEAGHAIADDGAEALGTGDRRAPMLLSAGKAFIGEYGGELMQDCVQLHGGLGVTFEHDVHLYLRRQTVNRALCGTPSQHRQRLTDLAQQQEDGKVAGK